MTVAPKNNDEYNNCTIEEALNLFYMKNSLGKEGGYNDMWYIIEFGFIKIPIPNIKAKKDKIYLHDISHIIMNYPTSWEGESSAAAWEIAAGGWKNLYVPWFLTLLALGLGVLFFPKAVNKGFEDGKQMSNAFICGIPKKELFKMKVCDLRNLLSNQKTRIINTSIFKFLGLLCFSIPFFLLGLIIFLIK
jgi:hypothetical protein